MNLYRYVGNSPVMFVDPLGLDGIYIHYDGYPVGTGLGFTLPLGHAAVVAVNPETGYTRYFEYGRYDEEGFGEVRTRKIPNVEIGDDCMATKESLEKLYEYLSEELGKNCPVSATYYDDADYKSIVAFAENRMNDPDRDPYAWNPFAPNHCKTFAKEAIDAARPGK